MPRRSRASRSGGRARAELLTRGSPIRGTLSGRDGRRTVRSLRGGGATFGPRSRRGEPSAGSLPRGAAAGSLPRGAFLTVRVRNLPSVPGRRARRIAGHRLAVVSTPSDLRIETLLVAGGRPAATPDGPLNEPITPASALHPGEVGYARGDAPAWQALEQVIGRLEGGEAVTFASGMAAATAAFTLFGERTVSSRRASATSTSAPRCRSFTTPAAPSCGSSTSPTPTR